MLFFPLRMQWKVSCWTPEHSQQWFTFEKLSHAGRSKHVLELHNLYAKWTGPEQCRLSRKLYHLHMYLIISYVSCWPQAGAHSQLGTRFCKC